MRDINGWTPLLWAARISYAWEKTSRERESIIRLLLDRGADLWVRGDGLREDREWSPLKLARYYGADKNIIQLLIPEIKQRECGGTWNSGTKIFMLQRRVEILMDVVMHVYW